MTKVFLGGSRKIGRLNKAIHERIDNILNKGFLILIGDANGADKAMQKYLSERNYSDVQVFCSGHYCRNNVGNWNTKNIEANNEKRDLKFYTVKDLAMAKEADYGLMLWDGQSKGTLNNILNLIESNKKVVIYFSPNKNFIVASTDEDLKKIMHKCSPEILEIFEKRSQSKKNLQGELNLH